MSHPRPSLLSRRRLGPASSAAAAALLLAACGGGSLGGDAESGSQDSDTVRVGLVIPQSGVYTPLGEDMANGWNLWLEQNDNKLGCYDADTTTVDEGESPDTGVPAVQRLLDEGEIDAVVGMVSSAVALGVAPLVTEAQLPLIVANAGADALTEAGSDYVWRVSFANAQHPTSMGEYLAAEGIGPVYVMAPDYSAGQDTAANFIAAYEAGGGTVAGQALTPFGTTQDFQPFLAGAQSSGAEAVFAFYAGGEAVSFVQQYDQFGLKDTMALYGSGFLTEGSVLEAQGEAAVGVQTTLHYSTELDNDANQTFVEAYQGAYDELPTVYAVQAYDAANVLDRALDGCEGLDGETITAALQDLGPIDDSPRGEWQFNDSHDPQQSIYLRDVTDEGGTLLNGVVEDLGVYPQP